jgi:hypothetical protein
VNKTDSPQQYTLTLQSDLPGLRLAGNGDPIALPPQLVQSVPVTLVAPGGTGGRHDVTFVLQSPEGHSVAVDSSFFGPQP